MLYLEGARMWDEVLLGRSPEKDILQCSVDGIFKRQAFLNLM